jgi:type II secretory pathway component GspD/PulD (secretin)
MSVALRATRAVATLALLCAAHTTLAQATQARPDSAAVRTRLDSTATQARRDSAAAQPRPDSVTIRIQNVDLRTAVQMMGQYLDRPVILGGQGTGPVSLETPRPVPRGDVIRLLRGILESQNFELIDDSASALYHARPRQATRPAAPAAPTAAQRQGAAQELFVLPLKHARAVDVAATVNTLYGRSSFAGANSRQTVPTLGEELRANLVPLSGAPATPAGMNEATRPNGLTGEIMIVSDEKANTLLVRANRADYDFIAGVVEQLDVRPLQVLIEVLIVEVARDHSLTINVDGTLGSTKVGKGSTTASGTFGTPGLGDFVLSVMGIGGNDLTANLEVAAERGDTRILSRPVLLTENNQQASITVGSQRPFVQLQQALPTQGTVSNQVVEYKDVGTKLTVKPTISIDGTVQLEVTQEVSNATTEVAFNAPVISTRSVQTQLLVRDGQTVALGGLTERQSDVTQGGLPLLSSIPWIGGLFGHSAHTTTETELFVFLTPRVIRTDDDAMRLSTPLRDRVEKIKP